MKVSANQEGLKLNNRHQLLVCADDINWQGKGKNATNKTTENSLIASKMVGLEVSKLCKIDKITKI